MLVAKLEILYMDLIGILLNIQKTVIESGHKQYNIIQGAGREVPVTLVLDRSSSNMKG